MSEPTTPPASWPVRLFEPIPRVRRELVRYQGLERGYACLPAKRHEARTFLDDVDQAVEDGRRMWTAEVGHAAVDDPRWPVRCTGLKCPVEGAYVFAADDPRYVMGARLMREVVLVGEAPQADPVRLDQLPVGAIYRARPDGMYLPFERASDGAVTLAGEGFMVVTADGLWWLGSKVADRSGAKHKLCRWTTTDTLEAVRLFGPASNWVLRESRLLPAAPNPNAAWRTA